MVNLALARNRMRERPVRRNGEAQVDSASPLASRLPVVNGKSTPTLSISAPEPPTNFIPFPSAPIPCAARPIESGVGDVQQSGGGVAMEVDVAPQPVSRNVRKRTKSGTSSDAGDDDDADLHPSMRRLPKRAMLRRANPRTADGAGRRTSVSAGSGLPLPRRARNTKKPGPDARFMAMVHRSIAWHVRTANDAADACVAQDVALTKRLWRHLIDQGMQPTLLDETREDSSMDTSCDSPASLRHLPPPPGLAPSNMLTMPQLVAVLTLRHRDRCASRARATPKDENSYFAKARHGPSSLSRVVFPAPERAHLG